MSVREESIPEGVVTDQREPRHDLQHRPWYVVPDYQPPGKPGPSVTAKVVNARGELVAHFESIEEARDVVSLVNGEQP